MQPKSPVRSSKVAIAASIVLVLMAMMLPVCHLHPLLDKGVPDHCTICVSLHAALPMSVHVQQAVSLLSLGRIIIASVQRQLGLVPRFAASRAPPLTAC